MAVVTNDDDGGVVVMGEWEGVGEAWACVPLLYSSPTILPFLAPPHRLVPLPSCSKWRCVKMKRQAIPCCHSPQFRGVGGV